jgi:hypothetical protein
MIRPNHDTFTAVNRTSKSSMYTLYSISYGKVISAHEENEKDQKVYDLRRENQQYLIDSMFQSKQ